MRFWELELLWEDEWRGNLKGERGKGKGEREKGKGKSGKVESIKYIGLKDCGLSSKCFN